MNQKNSELKRINLDAFKGSLDSQLGHFAINPPKSKLIYLDDEDYNIELNGVPIFKKGSKAEARGLVLLAKKNPARILFGKPSLMFTEANAEAERAALNDSVEFETQKYDDVNQDTHVIDFQREIGHSLEKLNLDITDKIKREEPYFVVSYGQGLGFVLREIWDTWKPKVLIVCEADKEMLYHSLDVFDWASLIKDIRAEGSQIVLIVDENPRTMLTRLNAAVQSECIIGLDGLLAIKVSNHPTINMVFAEFQSSKTGNLASYMGYIVDEYNMMKNSFRNLRTGDRRLLNTTRVKPELPVLIVGSGPSLEQNLDFVRSVRDRVILMASGSSLAVLLRNGIVPDYQAVLERARGNYERHKELAQEFNLKQITAILTTTIWPGSADYFKDAVFFLRPALSPLGVFCHTDAEILNGEGPQVTNTAFAFATRMGFTEIYLLGVDLGARDPNRPRAERAWLTPGLKQRELTIPVRGNFGRTVYTDNGLIQQRVTIENQIEKLRRKGGKVYNLGDGVLIAGSIPTKPETVKLTESRIDRVKHVEALTQQFPVMTRARFVSDWESSQVRLSVAKMIRQLTDTVCQAETWNHQMLRQLEVINQYVGKPVKNQYAPRLLRGSVLRMLMFMQSIMVRTPKEKEPEILQAIKPVWTDMMLRLERESYELADELENEDPFLEVIYPRASSSIPMQPFKQSRSPKPPCKDRKPKPPKQLL